MPGTPLCGLPSLSAAIESQTPPRIEVSYPLAAAVTLRNLDLLVPTHQRRAHMKRATRILPVLLLCGPAFAAERKPNFLIIMADQQSPHGLGCAGDRVVRTPHLDQLAASGVRFTAAYCGSP